MENATLSHIKRFNELPIHLPQPLSMVCTRILWHAAQAETPENLLRLVFAELTEVFKGAYIVLAAPSSGQWVVLASSSAANSPLKKGTGSELTGITTAKNDDSEVPVTLFQRSAKPLPIDLMAEALDREATKVSVPWIAVPLAPRAGGSEVLVVHLHDEMIKDETVKNVEHLAAVLQMALVSVRERENSLHRIRRLEAILEIANQWNQTHEVEPLLVQMAEAATRLLHADRASIFLWDKTNHVLVGRPALGIKKGELRIPDDRGVVGQVIQDGQPRRISAATEPDQINHQVDIQLRYQTRTLLCVPLRTGGGTGMSANARLGKPTAAPGELFGAFEIINKHSGVFTQEDEDALVELAAHAAVALENAQDRQQLLSTSRQMADQAAEGVQLIGGSPVIEALRSTIRRVADTDLAVLIQGENGTGKEVVAQAIHYGSRRRGRPFIAVNCAAIPETLAESELFGHEKGAFTDAREARAGKFELATGGTLFLDEIGDLSLGCQAKLLRVLEEKVLVRVGGSTPITTDTRVLTATNQNLAEMVREKRFREDLYFRLNVVTLELPPLRQRPGDIMLLAEHFLSDFCKKARRKLPQFTAAARKRLTEHPWPGNVRELRNLMERLAYLSTEDRIEAEDLAFILSPRGAAPLPADFNRPLPDATSQFQIQYIRQVIEQSGGNMSQAAERLGLHRSNLYRKMKQLGMV
jgi:transcriptional regulator with GAF, ATPase, and Fis domain